MADMFVDATDELYGDAYDIVINAGTTNEIRCPWGYGIYTINLDRETFSINNHTIFGIFLNTARLGNLPKPYPLTLTLRITLETIPVTATNTRQFTTSMVTL